MLPDLVLEFAVFALLLLLLVLIPIIEFAMGWAKIMQHFLDQDESLVPTKLDKELVYFLFIDAAIIAGLYYVHKYGIYY